MKSTILTCALLAALEPCLAQSTPDDTWLDGAQRTIQALEFHFSEAADGVYTAPNRPQNLRSRIGAGGIEVFPRIAAAGEAGADWKLTLRTVAAGREGHLGETQCVEVRARDERVELDHGSLTEWFVNAEDGIEQGWTVHARPAGPEDEPLLIVLEFGGDLVPRILDGGRDAVLVDGAGETRMRYRNLRAWDANEAELEARIVSTPHGPAVRVEDRGARYPLTVDPLLTDGVWTVTGQPGISRVGAVVASAGDVNGDGFSDFVVGAEDDYGNEWVRLELYYGAGSLPSTTPAWSHTFQSLLLLRASTAGDVNGDGFSDVLLQTHDPDPAGPRVRARVYLGSPDGLEALPHWTLAADSWISAEDWKASTAGDVNGDGYSDLVVAYEDDWAMHVALYEGGPNGLAGTVPAWTWQDLPVVGTRAIDVTVAGDVNGDGYSDFAVLEVYQERLFVFRGSSVGAVSTPSILTVPNVSERIANAGDVDGDGYGDLLVYSDLWSSRATYLFSGSSSGLAASPTWSHPGYAGTLGTVGDVDGDGYGDICVGVPGDYQIFTGGPSGLTSGDPLGIVPRTMGAGDFNGDGYSDLIEGHPGSHTYAILRLGGADRALSESDDWARSSSNPSSGFGEAVAAIGDVNGDGYEDLAVGAPDFDGGQAGAGKVFVWHGTPDGPSPNLAWTKQSRQAGAGFGSRVVGAGDVNGDGYGDLAISAPRIDKGQVDEGRVWVYHGGPNGLRRSSWVRSGNQDDAEFGHGLAGDGDVNGDGYSDLLVGTKFWDGAAGADCGKLSLYLGSPSGLGSVIWVDEGDASSDELGGNVCLIGDVNRDGACDLAGTKSEVSAGVLVYNGTATGIPVPGAEYSGSYQDAAIASGDVNGDGYVDVLIGDPSWDIGDGRVDLYMGSSAGLGSSPIWTRLGDDRDRFGRSITGGDFDGDGYSDFAIGEPGSYSQPDGEVYVYSGSAQGPVFSRTIVSAEDDALGWETAAGDFNGDGFSDLVLGAPRFGSNDRGRVYVYLGNRGRDTWLDHVRQVRFFSDTPISPGGVSDQSFAFRLRSELDSNIASFTWAMVEQPTFVYLETELKPIDVPFDGTNLGYSTDGPYPLPGETRSFTNYVACSQPPSTLPYKWRARLVFPGNPLLRNSPWVSMGRTRTEAMLRFE